VIPFWESRIDTSTAVSLMEAPSRRFTGNRSAKGVQGFPF
jgi:hypothetical protein